MPRKSASNIVSLAATAPRPVLTPIGPPLSKDEKLYFDFVVRTNNHLRVCDTPMVMLFAVTMARAMQARREGCETYEKEVRAALAIARSLRLTVQAAQEPKTVGRKREAPLPSFYELMGAQDDRS